MSAAGSQQEGAQGRRRGPDQGGRRQASGCRCKQAPHAWAPSPYRQVRRSAAQHGTAQGSAAQRTWRMSTAMPCSSSSASSVASSLAALSSSTHIGWVGGGRQHIRRDGRMPHAFATWRCSACLLCLRLCPSTRCLRVVQNGSAGAPTEQLPHGNQWPTHRAQAAPEAPAPPCAAPGRTPAGWPRPPCHRSSARTQKRCGGERRETGRRAEGPARGQ